MIVYYRFLKNYEVLLDKQKEIQPTGDDILDKIRKEQNREYGKKQKLEFYFKKGTLHFNNVMYMYEYVPDNEYFDDSVEDEEFYMVVFINSETLVIQKYGQHFNQEAWFDVLLEYERYISKNT